MQSWIPQSLVRSTSYPVWRSHYNNKGKASSSTLYRKKFGAINLQTVLRHRTTHWGCSLVEGAGEGKQKVGSC